MKNILITGGAGFIGSAIANRLITQEYNVTIFDNLSSKIHNNRDAYNNLKNKTNFIIGDVNVRKDWENAILDQDAIIHLASETGTGESMYDIYNYVNTNISATALMLDVLTNSQHNIKKLILSSSRSIYGEGKYLCAKHGDIYPLERDQKQLGNKYFDFICPHCDSPIKEVATDEKSLINPLSIYAISKLNQEQMILLIGKNLNINTTVLRFQNVYGPGQSLSNPYTGILSIFSTRILNNNNIEIYEDGNESRDFIYIDDVVEASFLSLVDDKNSGQVFNVGTGKQVSVLDVARKLKSIFKSNINIEITGKFRIGDIRHNFADISKINNYLGFSPKFSFDEGLFKFASWVKTQEIHDDKYSESISKLEDKGLIK